MSFLGQLVKDEKGLGFTISRINNVQISFFTGTEHSTSLVFCPLSIQKIHKIIDVLFCFEAETGLIAFRLKKK